MTPALRTVCLAEFDVMFCCSGINTDPNHWDSEQKFTEQQNVSTENVKNICYCIFKYLIFLENPFLWLWRGEGDVSLPSSAVGGGGCSHSCWSGCPYFGLLNPWGQTWSWNSHTWFQLGEASTIFSLQTPSLLFSFCVFYFLIWILELFHAGAFWACSCAIIPRRNY